MNTVSYTHLESAIPLLKGAVSMYREDKSEEWLVLAENAAWYLSTWQYSCTEKFSKETTLGKTGYDSFGGTLVSTVHEGMDSFALSYVPELYELGEQTGQTRWIERAKAIWRNGCQHVSDGTMIIDGHVRPCLLYTSSNTEFNKSSSICDWRYSGYVYLSYCYVGCTVWSGYGNEYV